MEFEVLRKAVEEINAGLFFEAHETLELAWAPCRTSNRLFLQAVIHAAVGAHHARQGNAAGMDRQFAKAARKLKAYLPEHEGLDTSRLSQTLEDLRHLLAAANCIPEIPQPLVCWKSTPGGECARQNTMRSC
jgi:predicted metal-dependent hydrolase